MLAKLLFVADCLVAVLDRLQASAASGGLFQIIKPGKLL
jgi:hypothetical protein